MVTPRKVGWPTKVTAAVAVCLSLLFAAAGASSSPSFDRAAAVLIGLATSVRRWLVAPYLFLCINLIVLLIWKLSEKQEEENSTSTRDAVNENRKSVTDLPRPRPRSSSPDHHPRHPSPLPTTPGGGEPAEFKPRDAEPPPAAEKVLTVDGDSMEDTWQAIMEGGASPVRRYLAKSGTWGEQGRRLERAAGGNVAREMRKSKTFRERPAAPAAAGGRDVFAMAREEPDSKFEEFIRATHERMRLQRMESHHRYLRRAAAVLE